MKAKLKYVSISITYVDSFELKQIFDKVYKQIKIGKLRMADKVNTAHFEYTVDFDIDIRNETHNGQEFLVIPSAMNQDQKKRKK